MDIGRTDGVSGSGRIDSVQRVNRIAKAYGVAGPQPASDRVNISPEAGLVSKALAMPDVRLDRIQEIRKLVESGQYETETRLSGAIERFMVENPDISTD
jgi:hypothetical protein